MSEIPEIENCCDKEPYAFFGLACYCAQVFENATLNLAIVLRLPAVDLVSQQLFDELYESLSKKTLGPLLSAVKQEIDLSEEDRVFLEEAVELRNILIHRYFRERAEDFVSAAGREEMKRELQLIISKFKHADQLLEGIYIPLWEKYGVTEELVENELERVRAEAEQRDKNA